MSTVIAVYWTTLNEFVKSSGYSKRTVLKSIKELEEDGLVRVTHQPNGRMKVEMFLHADDPESPQVVTRKATSCDSCDE